MGGSSKWWTRCKNTKTTTTTNIRVPLRCIAMPWSVRIRAFSFRIGQVFWVPVLSNHSTHIVGSQDHKLKPQILVVGIPLPPNIKIRILQVHNYRDVYPGALYWCSIIKPPSRLDIAPDIPHKSSSLMGRERERHAKKLLLSVTSAEPGWLSYLLSSVLKSIPAAPQKSSYLRKRKRQSLPSMTVCCTTGLSLFLGHVSGTLFHQFADVMISCHGVGPGSVGSWLQQHQAYSQRYEMENMKSPNPLQNSLSLSLSLSLSFSFSLSISLSLSLTHTHTHTWCSNTHTRAHTHMMLKRVRAHTHTHTHTHTHIVLVVMMVAIVSVVTVAVVTVAVVTDRVFYRRR